MLKHYASIYIKIVPVVRLGGLAPARPITPGGEIHNTMARRVSVLPRRMTNTGQDRIFSELVGSPLLQIRHVHLQTPRVPSHVSNSESAGGNCACAVKIMAKNRILVKSRGQTC